MKYVTKQDRMSKISVFLSSFLITGITESFVKKGAEISLLRKWSIMTTLPEGSIISSPEPNFFFQAYILVKTKNTLSIYRPQV